MSLIKIKFVCALNSQVFILFMFLGFTSSKLSKTFKYFTKLHFLKKKECSVALLSLRTYRIWENAWKVCYRYRSDV